MKKVYFELESLDKIHEAARYFLNAVGDANIFRTAVRPMKKTYRS